MSDFNMETIVITAFGCVTPIGSDYSTIKNALSGGISGIKKINKFSCDHFITKHAGIPDEGNEKLHWPSKGRAKIGELFYLDLATERLKSHPSFPVNFYEEEQIGCFLGVDEPAIDIQICLEVFRKYKYDNNKLNLLEQLAKKFKVSDLMNIEPSSALGQVHKHIPFQGHSACHLGLCSASLQAMGMALQSLRADRIDAAIVGGASAKVTPINLARLELLSAISTDEQLPYLEQSRPFDSRRSGFVLAEGSVVFFIEKLKNVLKRNEMGLLNLLGYGSSLSSQHIVTPHTQSLEMELSMRRAIESARVNMSEIDIINAHGTSTILNDFHESEAINNIFGDKTQNILVTGNKSIHGHLIAAAGAMEVLNTLISLNENFIPPTINLCNKDSKCNVNIVKTKTDTDAKFILKNSFGMGGLAASMILGRPNEL